MESNIVTSGDVTIKLSDLRRLERLAKETQVQIDAKITPLENQITQLKSNLAIVTKRLNEAEFDINNKVQMARINYEERYKLDKVSLEIQMKAQKGYIDIYNRLTNDLSKMDIWQFKKWRNKYIQENGIK